MNVRKTTVSEILFPVSLLLIIISSYFIPFVYQMRAAIGLVTGILLSLIFTNPYADFSRKHVSTLLTWSIVGLGFGINLVTVASVGITGLGYTLTSLICCISAGLTLGYGLKNTRNTSVLLSCGTAICGGSAIAALAPVIKAKEHEISIALVIIFLLNGVALLIFPFIGHRIGLSQEQFGLWSALAIHDTSSVVGATMQYGQQALEVGTTVKLARALWIVPMTLLTAWIYTCFVFSKNEKNDTKSIKKPWFILGFLAAAALVTWLPVLKPAGLFLRSIAETGLVAALFCIGANFSKAALMHVGPRPFIQGLALWILMSIGTLLFVLY